MSGETIVAIQARMGSSRLPGKVLSDICGKPMIQRVWDACEGPWDRVVLTSILQPDDALCVHLEAAGIPYRRGPGEDVLMRYWQLAYDRRPGCLVRICGDAPFMRSKWIAAAVAEEDAVFVPNALHAGNWEAWEMANRQAAPHDWEHAGSHWFEQHSTILHLVPKGYRMVNTQADLEVARRRWIEK